MTSHQIERFDKAKTKEDEVSRRTVKIVVKGLSTSLSEESGDEKDVPKSTIEELIEINIDLDDSEKIDVGRIPINKSRKGKSDRMPEEKK